jgi:hypothetical protein
MTELKIHLVKGDRVYFCDIVGEERRLVRYKSDKGTVRSMSNCLTAENRTYAVVEWDTGEIDDICPESGDFEQGTVRRSRWQSKAKAR